MKSLKDSRGSGLQQLNHKYFNFFIVILITFFFLEGCSFLSSEKKASDIARIACNAFHSMELEPPNNIKAVLITFDEAQKMLGQNINRPPMSADSQVWFVRLTGKWQLVGGPLPVETPAPSNLSVATPELWNVCEVIIDPNDHWHPFYVGHPNEEAGP